ncbi:MAG: hypothetical protein ACK40G_13025 [Cytophagaceae bacterium]
MKKIFLYAVSLSAFIILTDCKSRQCNDSAKSNNSKQPFKTQNLNEPSLDGTWTLHTLICCGRTKTTRTGAEIERQKTLIFEGENVTIVSRDKNEDAPTTETNKFEVKEEQRGSGSMLKYINTGNPNRFGIIKLSHDSLTIDYGYMDLQKEIYLRKK